MPCGRGYAAQGVLSRTPTFRQRRIARHCRRCPRTGYTELKLAINRSLTAFCVPEVRKNEDVGHRTGGPGDHAACPKLPALSRQPQRETTTVPKSRPRACVPKPPAGARPADLDDSVAAAERKSRKDTCQSQGSIKQFTCRCPSCQDVDISSKRGLAHS
jgi:hypothetical protein